MNKEDNDKKIWNKKEKRYLMIWTLLKVLIRFIKEF